MHLNNGNYLRLMDLARSQHVFLIKNMYKTVRDHRWGSVVARIEINYHRSIGVFTPVQILTRISHWDNQAFTIKQRFISNGKVMAVASVRSVILGPQGNVAPQDVIETLGLAITSPAPTPLVGISGTED